MKIICGPEVNVTPQAIGSSAIMENWLAAFTPGWLIETCYVHSLHARDDVIRMMQVSVTAVDPDGQRQTNLLLLRGGTVDVLTILRVEDTGEAYLAFVEQYRMAAGSTVLSNPAGAIDPDDSDRLSTVIRELREEIGEDLDWNNPICLNPVKPQYGPRPFLVSPGGTDEYVYFFFIEVEVSRAKLEELSRRTAGLAEEGEQTKIRLVPYAHAFTVLNNQGDNLCLKTYTSLLLYRQKKQSGE